MEQVSRYLTFTDSLVSCEQKMGSDTEQVQVSSPEEGEDMELMVDYDPDSPEASDLKDPYPVVDIEEREQLESRGDKSPSTTGGRAEAANNSANMSKRKLSVADYKAAHPGKSTFPKISDRKIKSSSIGEQKPKEDPRDLVSYEDTTDPALSARYYDSDVESRTSRAGSAFGEPKGSRRTDETIIPLYDVSTIEFHKLYFGDETFVDKPTDVYDKFLQWNHLRKRNITEMTPGGADKSWTAFVKAYNYGPEDFTERMDKLDHHAMKYGRRWKIDSKQAAGFVPWTLETLPKPTGSFRPDELRGRSKRRRVSRSPPRESGGDSSFETDYQPDVDSPRTGERHPERQNVSRSKVPKSVSHTPTTLPEAVELPGTSGGLELTQQSIAPPQWSLSEAQYQGLDHRVQKNLGWLTSVWDDVAQLRKDRDDHREQLSQLKKTLFESQQENLQLRRKILELKENYLDLRSQLLERKA